MLEVIIFEAQLSLSYTHAEPALNDYNIWWGRFFVIIEWGSFFSDY